jgi:hypothetical protein
MNRSSVVAWPLAVVAAAGWPVGPAWAADGARTFAPSGEWTVSSDAESCSIVRQFGSADDGVSFRLQAFAPGGHYRAVLRGKPLPQRDSGALEFDYSFEPDPGAIPVTGVLAKSNGVPMVSFTTALNTSAVVQDQSERPEEASAAQARVAAVNEFVIAFSRGRPLALQLGSMAEPIAQLNACSAELPRKWGLDPAVQQSLRRPATPIDQASWLGPGTYPWAYLRNSQSLMVHVRMLVDERGAPAECVVQAPRTQSGAEALACREIMKTARFEPALDSAGNPVRSYHATTIFYYTRRRNGPDSRGGTIMGAP